MSDEFVTLELTQNGDITTVGFGGREVLDQINIAICREQITDFVKRNQSKILTFEMAGVLFIPSGMLGLLASLRNVVEKIQIIHPSEDVLEVLEVTKLNQIIEVR